MNLGRKEKTMKWVFKVIAIAIELNPLTAHHNATIQIVRTNGPGKDIVFL